MISSNITVIDYGMGNLWSVLSALRYLGSNPTISSSPEEIVRADALLLPGVGSFRKAMNSLQKNGIDQAIVEAVQSKGTKILGICLGMQMSVIEFARNQLGLPKAHSTEMDPATPDPVIDLMEGQKAITKKGGTMRLGAYPCKIEKDSLAYQIYGSELISERHRHRWEFNNKYLDAMQAAGLKASGLNQETNLVEIVEIPDHPFFIGVQYHPELKSTVENPHPIFVHFVKAAKAFSAKKEVNDPGSMRGDMI
jgi:CTP synthase